MSTVDEKMMRLSWRYNKFTKACKPPALLELSESREIRLRHQIEFCENVGNDILLSGRYGLIQFSNEFVPSDPLVFLLEPGRQSKIEFAPGDGLRGEVRNAGCRVCAVIFGQGLEGFSQRGTVSNRFLQRGKLIDGNVD